MHKRRVGHTSEAGFSLLELVVAVSIVAIMVGVITPHLVGASTRATSTACRGNEKTITAALAEYKMIHGSLPSGDSLAQIQALVSDQLLANDALNGNYVIDDTNSDDITVSCPGGGVGNATP